MFNMSSQNTFGKVKLNDKVESRVRGDLYARFGGECLETYHCNKWQGAGCLAYEQHKALVEIQQQNESLKQENETLQNNIDKYSFTLNEKSNELNRLEILTKENQRLRDRETYLSNLLIKDIRVIKNLKDKKSPINILQWDEIKKNIDLLFDNYTIRLSQVIPSMTESDLQVCCLIKLRFSNLDIADILNISPTSVSKRKFRLKERIIQKLGSLGESHTLDLWLLEF